MSNKSVMLDFEMRFLSKKQPTEFRLAFIRSVQWEPRGISRMELVRRGNSMCHLK